MEKLNIEENTWRGMDAWKISGPQLEVVVTRIGASIAAIRKPGEELNPLWQPSWQSSTPEEGAKKPEIYGPMPEGPLLAVIVGHNVCLDRFGAPWPGEDKTVHGEAPVARWSLDQSNTESVTLSCDLPQAGLKLTRTLSIDGDLLTVETTVVPKSGAEVEIEWAEHVTVGDPFLDGARITAKVDGAWIADMDAEETRRFRDVPVWGAVDVEKALSMPTADESQPWGDVVTARVIEGWFRVERPDLGKRLEYRWDADEFPWLALWTQHHSRTGKPWSGRERAKGLEFSSKPFPEGKPPAERATEFQGRPAVCRIPAGGLSRSFTARWTAV